MRTLAITQNITVDGSIEMLKDWFDPQRQGVPDGSELPRLRLLGSKAFRSGIVLQRYAPA